MARGCPRHTLSVVIPFDNGQFYLERHLHLLTAIEVVPAVHRHHKFLPMEQVYLAEIRVK